MAIRDPAATRRRVVDAARVVFAERGPAGARVDAIAAAAQTSKERLYANFRTKDELFELVLGESVDEWLSAVPFTVDDLPGYAGALFDHLCTHDVDARLILWGQLSSRSTSALMQTGEELLERRGVEVADAQARGAINPDWDPADLFVMIYGVVMSWIINPGTPTMPHVAHVEQQRRRSIVASTVSLLVQPRGR